MIQVHLNQIPEGDVLILTGEADSSFLGLEEAEMEAVGPLCYHLEVGLSHGGLFATGKLSQKARLTCVCCLESFEYLLEVKNFAMQQDLTGSELVDLTETIREDIHLLLPMHPRCTLGGAQCPVQFPQRVIPLAEDSEIRSVWSALDNIT